MSLITKSNHDELYRKAALEQKRWRDKLLAQKPQVILDSAAEYLIREELLQLLEERTLPEDFAEALSWEVRPLATLYKSLYIDISETIEEELWTAIYNAARDSLYKKERKNSNGS
ncbi:MAG: DUF3848 domain-containing protein [Oscillospiraceae bacterium]|nr:DUF3848 domain-containing protein [Oscillospiraceae bacterium]